MADERPVCPWELDAEGHVPLTEVLKANDDCRWPDGFRGWSVSMAVYDNLGHRLEGDADPTGRHGCRHCEAPKQKTEHRKHWSTVARPKEQHMADTKDVYLPANIKTLHADGVQADATHAEVGVPSFDLSQVLPADGTISPMAATLGGLAILGGVALKVIPSWLKARADMATQRLALKAKRLELEQQAKQQEQGGDCASRHAACLSAVAALEERVKLVEKQADGLAMEVASVKDAATKLSLTGNGSVDIDRVTKLEEQVAKLTAKVGADERREE